MNYLADSLSWSALAVTGLAVAVWAIAAAARRCGAALGAVPPFAVLTAIPIVTVLTFAPTWPTPTDEGRATPVNESLKAVAWTPDFEKAGAEPGAAAPPTPTATVYGAGTSAAE